MCVPSWRSLHRGPLHVRDDRRLPVVSAYSTEGAMTVCEVKGCGEEALVGWGPKPVWLCMTHLNEALQEAKKFHDDLIAAEIQEKRAS